MPKIAKTPARFSGAKRLVIIGRPCGAMSAAPSPCAARARMSWVGSCATPLSADATVNVPTPATKRARGPNMSPSRADVMRSTA